MPLKSIYFCISSVLTVSAHFSKHDDNDDDDDDDDGGNKTGQSNHIKRDKTYLKKKDINGKEMKWGNNFISELHLEVC